MLELKVIVGSTRPGRAADRIIPWLCRRVHDHGRFTAEVLDLRDWSLPMFGESHAMLGDLHNPTYSAPIVKRWNEKISEGEAYIFVTPEYNHSVPAALKNAIDSVFASFAFRNKPAASIAYSGGQVGGARATEHLAHIGIEAELVPLRNAVLIPHVHEAFDAAGLPLHDKTERALTIVLDDLAWWAKLLRDGRANGMAPPAQLRTVPLGRTEGP
jgi:NAD(P)H-dependent FMN reductase